MPSITRLVGFVLVAIGVIGYLVTRGASLTALIPAMVGAVFIVLALVARIDTARRHAMHATVALALIAVLGTLPRLLPSLRAGEWQRASVIAQLLMTVTLAIYVVLGVKSFIDARRSRMGR